MEAEPVRVDAAELPLERWTDAARGAVSWRTLLSADRTPTRALICGLASLNAGEGLALHRHAQDEVYFGVRGRVRVRIGEAEHELGPGVALFIPGDAPHEVVAEEPAEFFYAFAGDSFDEVVYEFLEEARDGA